MTELYFMPTISLWIYDAFICIKLVLIYILPKILLPPPRGGQG
jgi:hypothetical protein